MALSRASTFAVALMAAVAPHTGAQVRGPDVTGQVNDRAGHPIASATIAIPDLNRSATTDASGRFTFTAVPEGRYTVSARRIGYLATSVPLSVATPAPQVMITLDASALRIDPVNVTATRTPIASGESPLSMGVLAGDEVHAEDAISIAHAIAQLPGVRSVTSGKQIGKPMIRGLVGPRVLVLSDGSRIEDYSWSDEDGPSIDARLAQRIEVIRGPASVLYGSEALGGVVNVIPGELPYSADGSSTRRSHLEAYGASNNIELGGVGMIEGAQSRYGWRGQVTGRFGDNYRSPVSTVQNSSFWAFNGDGAFGINNDHGNTTVRLSHYGGEFHLLEASGPEAGDSTGGPVRQTLDDRLQVTSSYLTHGVRLETKAQWQRHSLTEVSDDCQPAPGQVTCAKVKDQQAFGLTLNTGTLDILAHHTAGEHLTGTLGVSGLYQANDVSGPIFLVPAATTTGASAFIFEQLSVGRVSLAAGGRGDTRGLSSDASTPLGLAARERNWSDASGDVGAVVHVTSALSIVGNFGTGWRAPTLFDLYTNGPNRADARYEIGDPNMRAERSYNFDGGMRWNNEVARVEATLFRNDVDNFIYNAPTAQSIGGLQVFRHAQTNARLTGGEFSAAVAATDMLTLRASYDLVEGTDKASRTPLPLMPPPRFIVGANLHGADLGWARRASIGADVENNARQTRLGQGDVPTAAYTLVNVDFMMERVVGARELRFDVDVRNATNTTYRDFLSRYKTFAYAPGANIVFKLSTAAW